MKKYLFLIPLIVLFTGCFNDDKKDKNKKKVDLSGYEQTQKEIKREPPEVQKHFSGGGYSGSNGGSHYYKKKKKRLF